MAILAEYWRNGEGADLVIGNARDAERASRMPATSDNGIHRYCRVIGRTAYKMPWAPEYSINNIEEYAAMMMLRRCSCPMREYATPITLYRVDSGLIVAAMPAYRTHGWDADRVARNEFLHRMVHHNAQGHHPYIMDMHEGNFMQDAMGRIRIVDLGFGDECAAWAWNPVRCPHTGHTLV
jgi:hypothetical protein